VVDETYGHLEERLSMTPCWLLLETAQKPCSHKRSGGRDLSRLLIYKEKS
jgi:hypothetical protein